MKCQNVELLLSDYLDGELPPAQVERVHEHLGRCPRCAGKWRALRQTLRLVAHYGRESCPFDLRERVVQAVADRAAASRHPAPGWRIPWVPFPVWSGAGAGLVAVVMAVALWRFAPLAPSAPPAALEPAAEARLHDQYHLAAGLGVADGLVLALPPEQEAEPADSRPVR